MKDTANLSIDELLKAASATSNMKLRSRLIGQASALHAERAQPIVPLIDLDGPDLADDQIG